MAKALDRTYAVQDARAIDVGVLETFPYEYAGKDIAMTIASEEFTALCPWSGLPDFGNVTIEYIPAKVCIELRSLKYYLLSYRQVGIYQEHAVNRIADDLARATRPRWMRVTLDYRIRGGIHTVTSREIGRRPQRT